jgi:hypothetical protein
MNNRSYLLMVISLLLFFSQSCSALRNPFKYSKSCTSSPLCECIALGKAGTNAFAVVSVNSMLYTVKKGDIIAGYQVTRFVDNGLVFHNNKNREIRLFLKEKALQLK